MNGKHLRKVNPQLFLMFYIIKKKKYVLLMVKKLF